MEKVIFSKEKKTLEASGVGGYLLVVRDDEAPKKWLFKRKFKMTFVFDNKQISIQTSRNSCQAEAGQLGYDRGGVAKVEMLIKDPGSSSTTSNEPVLASSMPDSLPQDDENIYSESLRPLAIMGGKHRMNAGAGATHLNDSHHKFGGKISENLPGASRYLTDQLSKEEIQGTSSEFYDNQGGDVVYGDLPLGTALSSDYPCRFCHTCFPTAKELKDHMRDPSYQVECDRCKLLFPSRGDLFLHQLETYDLDFVKQHFPEFENIGKMETPKHGGTIHCPICTKPSSPSNFKAHILSQHFSELSYKCCVCDKAVTNDKACFGHCRIHLKGNHRIIVQDRNLNSSADATDNELGSQKCKMEGEDLRTTPMGDESSVKETISSKMLQRKRPIKSPLLQSKTISRSKKHSNRVDMKSARMFIHPDKLSVEVVPGIETSSTPRHKNSHFTEKRYFCPHCQQSFRTPVKFQAHRKAPNLNLKCSLCDVILASRANLLIHEQEVHNLHSNVSAQSEAESALVPDKVATGKMEQNANRIKSRQYVLCPVCSLEITRPKLLYHVMRSHTGEYPLSCCVCHLQFSSQDMLATHYNKHSKASGNEKIQIRKRIRKPQPKLGIFTCKNCSEVFHSKSQLHRHSAQHRTVCVFCNEDFQLVKLVEEHYEQEHFDQLLDCSFCDKKLPTKEKLRIHERNHKFAKPKPCHKCGAMVTRLKEHMKKLHSEPGPQMACVICGMKFKTASALERHQRNAHSDPDKQNSFSCPKCQKMFATRDRMSNHVKKMHINNKIFQCEICGKRCTQKFNLRVHMRSHSNQTFFTCELCGQGFKYKASLQGHMQSKHNVPVPGKLPVIN